MPYRDMRRAQARGVKLLGQCSLIRKDGMRSVRGACDCQHRGGRELGRDGTANACELLINVVMINKPKVLRGWPKRDVARFWGLVPPDAAKRVTGGQAEPTPSWYMCGTW
jgi:hypothetical protein